MAKIKGKWLFNNAVTPLTWLNEYQIENVNFISNGEHFTDIYWNEIDADEGAVYHIYYADTLAVSGYYGNVSNWENEAYKTIEFDGEQEVSENFVAWMQANATLQEEEKPTPTAEGVKSKLQSLITASNAKTGKSDANLTDAVNTLIEGYGQGGGGGECSGNHIIEVDELPEVGVEGAVYKCQGKYYEWFFGFADAVVYFINQFIPFGDFMAEMGGAFQAHTIPTKTTEGISESTETEYHFYYIEDENDVFLFQNGSWNSFSTFGMGTFGGVIEDISEVTDIKCYYALFAYRWIEYAETVPVNIPTTYTVQTVAELPTDVPNGSWAIVVGGE